MRTFEDSTMVHDTDGYFGMRYKISVAKQFVVNVCLLHVPSNSGNKYCVIVAQMNRKEQYRQVLNASAIQQHFEDHIDVVTYDEEEYGKAYEAYLNLVTLANQLYIGRERFWD